MGIKINDQFTHLKVSRQRKWNLRHPEKAKALRERYDRTPKARLKKTKATKKYIQYHDFTSRYRIDIKKIKLKEL